MPETYQKLKENQNGQQKTRQGEADSSLVRLNWEGGEVHHQQCTCSIKFGPRNKYFAPLHMLTNICFITSNPESNSGSFNLRNSQQEEGWRMKSLRNLVEQIQNVILLKGMRYM